MNLKFKFELSAQEINKILIAQGRQRLGKAEMRELISELDCEVHALILEVIDGVITSIFEENDSED